MESLSKQELISTITTQGDQIKRYETRLRDVVAAYKGLIKEKEALELSLNAINNRQKESDASDKDDSVAALTLSLSTLTTEKSRLEEAFQADKKLTREKYESMLIAMKEEAKAIFQQHQAETNNLKAKIAYEIQEREKERADHSAMLKELHIKLNTERKSKEKLEDKFAISTETHASNTDMEKRVRDLSGELEAAQRKLQRAEARTVETPQLLVRLQEKMALLQQSHSVAIREEQIKAKRAEEAARKVCAKQEERVALLEDKLAELSQTVGEYDLRRRRDEQIIKQLKESLNSQILDKTTTSQEQIAFDEVKSETDNDKLADSEYLHNVIDKIHILKKELISENVKLGSPIDITRVFSLDGYEHVHEKCRRDLEKAKLDFEVYKSKHMNDNASHVDDDLVNAHKEITILQKQVTELNERVDTCHLMLDQEKLDKEHSLKIYEEKLTNEGVYYKEVVADLRTRIQSLEKQVQTQRDRYAALLEETDNYIKSRNDRNDRSRKVSFEDGNWKENHVLPDMSAPPHMLHYAHELARKDLDISQLRKDKHILEGQLRDIQRESTIEKERFKEVMRTLKEEIDRLRRIQSREGANLEYLKNVVLAYLMSSDYAGRKHMLNAIAAVLHFTNSERNMVLSTL